MHRANRLKYDHEVYVDLFVGLDNPGPVSDCHLDVVIPSQLGLGFSLSEEYHRGVIAPSEIIQRATRHLPQAFAKKFVLLGR